MKRSPASLQRAKARLKAKTEPQAESAVGAEKERRKPLDPLRRGTTWLVGLVIATITTLVVTQAFPGVTDRVEDLWDDTPLLVAAEALDTGQGRWALAWATPYAFPQPHGNAEALLRALKRSGGAPAGQATQELLFSNRRSTSIRITGIRAVDIQRVEPFDGSLLLQEAQGEGRDSVGDLDLDLEPAELTERKEDGKKGPRFFEANNITLERGEEHQLSIRSSTTTCACTWRLEISYRYQGSTHSVVVPTRDQAPFRLTANVRKYTSVYDLTPVTYPNWKRLDRAPCDEPGNPCGLP